MRSFEGTRRTRLVGFCSEHLRGSIWQRTVMGRIAGLLHVCAIKWKE